MRIAFLIFFLGFILSGCTFPWEKDEKISTSYKDDLEIASEKIKETAKFEECMKPHVHMCINSVGTDLSREKKDKNFCEELSTPTDRENCKYVITLLEATEKKDPGICDTLTGDHKNNCTYTIISTNAREKKDPSICDTIIPKNIEKESTEYLIFAEKKQRCI